MICSLAYEQREALLDLLMAVADCERDLDEFRHQLGRSAFSPRDLFTQMDWFDLGVVTRSNFVEFCRYLPGLRYAVD